MNLNNVSIGIKTFLRDGALFNTIAAIRRTMPEVKMIIADDGEMSEEKDGIYADLEKEGHTIIHLPFDSGFGMKSNRIADALSNPYLLIGSDDFDFNPSYVREGIEKMMEILDSTDVDVIGGRVGWPYEFDLEEKENGVVIERPVKVSGPTPWFVKCDLTVNYKLVKKHVFEKARWMDSIKIGGGEHAYWFLLCKKAGFKVAWAPGAEIREQKLSHDSRYWSYRARSSDKARPCFDAIGVKKYILGNGQVDYQL
ncbi:MAG: hypothetical protein OK457_00210 [Thaumarchaeota archaeon]|nr:hypothetical protein [Nitrososphaerota archaeon]